MKAFKKIITGFALLFFSLSVFAGLFNDIKHGVNRAKDEAFDSYKTHVGYGLVYMVLNATPQHVIASETIIPSSATKSMSDVRKAKQKTYTIYGGQSTPKESSMYIKDQQTGKQICKVNVSFNVKLGVADKRPTISKLAPSITQLSNYFACQVVDAKTTTVDGKTVAVVTTMVIPLAALPPQQFPK